MKLKVGDQVWYKKGVHIITWISMREHLVFLDGIGTAIEIRSLKKYRPVIGKGRKG